MKATWHSDTWKFRLIQHRVGVYLLWMHIFDSIQNYLKITSICTLNLTQIILLFIPSSRVICLNFTLICRQFQWNCLKFGSNLLQIWFKIAMNLPQTWFNFTTNFPRNWFELVSWNFLRICLEYAKNTYNDSQPVLNSLPEWTQNG